MGEEKPAQVPATAWYDSMTEEQRVFWYAARNKQRARELGNLLKARVLYRWAAIWLVVWVLFDGLKFQAGIPYEGFLWRGLALVGVGILIAGLLYEFWVIDWKAEGMKYLGIGDEDKTEAPGSSITRTEHFDG